MTTREALNFAGEELDGMIAAKWFKKHCDGCSFPTKVAKRSYMAKMLRAGCDCHDAEYTTIPLMWPHKSRRAKKERKLADKRLRRNTRTIMGAMGKHRWRGAIVGTIIWAGLRPFGRWAMTPPLTKIERMPVSLEEFSEFVLMIEEFYGPITSHGAVQLDSIARKMRIER